MSELEKAKTEIENILVTIDLEKIEFIDEDGNVRDI